MGVNECVCGGGGRGGGGSFVTEDPKAKQKHADFIPPCGCCKVYTKVNVAPKCMF